MLRPPFLASLLLLAISLITSPVRAGGLVGDGPQRRVDQEVFFVVWDHLSLTQHLLVAARATGLTSPGALLLALPLRTTLERPLDGIPDAIHAIQPGLNLLPSIPGAPPELVPRPSGLEALCTSRKLTCRSELLGWAKEQFASKELVLLPLSPSHEGTAISTYAHFRFDTQHPLIPFAEPTEDRPEPEPPPPGPEHPPRVQIFLALANESPAGLWERQMDAAADTRRADLINCYSQVLKQKRKLTGSVHVQLRIDTEGVVSDEEERADSKPLEPVARCFAAALLKAPWPKNPFPKPIQFEAHATLRPPVASPRRTLAVVLASRDVEPRLGDPDGTHLVPELRPIAGFEPEPASLRAAFSEEARRALGIDLSRRWRLRIFETSVDPHGPVDDIAFRLLSLPPPRPSSPPWPVVDRGDHPEHHTTSPPPIGRKRRKNLLIAALLLSLVLVAVVVWLYLRSSSRGGSRGFLP
ncbi:MAG: hypothetical protein RMJ98_11355 [Myxococcales bacterium]|nr:hypothetical protein [Myxococcales bacterium]